MKYRGLKERSNQNMCVEEEEDEVDNSDNNSVVGGDKHLTHLTKAVDCCLKERSKPNKCVDDKKDNSVEDSADGGDRHLTNLIKQLIVV
eukprot:1658220-Ditylum_brightwellii.AAC.1